MLRHTGESRYQVFGAARPFLDPGFHRGNNFLPRHHYWRVTDFGLIMAWFNTDDPVKSSGVCHCMESAMADVNL
jgi:hypothetical protein